MRGAVFFELTGREANMPRKMHVRTLGWCAEESAPEERVARANSGEDISPTCDRNGARQGASGGAVDEGDMAPAVLALPVLAPAVVVVMLAVTWFEMRVRRDAVVEGRAI